MQNFFFYMYAPNGWGLQVTGMCSDDCPDHATSYDFCTQGITGACSHDAAATVFV